MANYCRSCGRDLAEDDLFCPSCGVRVSTQAVASSGAEKGGHLRESPKLIRCPDCGAEISARAFSCPRCGALIRGAEAMAQMVRRDWGFEWRSKAEVFGYPLIHIAFGRKAGKLRVAKGIIAIGQFALGLITIAQFGIGILFGFGQFILGLTGIAQFAITLIFGLGQFATGYIAIGQIAIGIYALGQFALGKYIWTAKFKDPEAVAFFLKLLKRLGLK